MIDSEVPNEPRVSTLGLSHKRSRRFLVTPDGVKSHIYRATGKDVERVVKVNKESEFERYDVWLNDQSQLSVKVFFPSVPAFVVESEVATIRYLTHHTSIPLPNIICFNSGDRDEDYLFIASEKVSGVNLSSVYQDIPSLQKDALVTKIARWILDLYHLRFDKIGSLHLSTDQNTVTVGPISTDVWNIDGRARIEGIDRGPWSTARDYFKACAQRELDCLKPLLSQEASEGYKRTVEENSAQVEYSMWLMMRIIGDCEGLDDDDPSFAPFAMDSRAFEPETIFVSREDFSKILLVDGWRNTTIRPLWHCAHLPSWLKSSLYEADDASDKRSLEKVFRKTVSGLDRNFALGLEAGGTRQSLEEVCSYDALKDGYIVTPTLQSISMTLPGNLDIESIKEVLNPKTDVGRVARTMSVTQGSAWESMSMNIKLPPWTPTKNSPTSPSNVYPPTLPNPRSGKPQTGEPRQIKESDTRGVLGAGEAMPSEKAITVTPGPLGRQSALTNQTDADDENSGPSHIPLDPPSYPGTEDIAQTPLEDDQNGVSILDEIDGTRHSSTAEAEGHSTNLGGSHQDPISRQSQQGDPTAAVNDPDRVEGHYNFSGGSTEVIHNEREAEIKPDRDDDNNCAYQVQTNATDSEAQTEDKSHGPGSASASNSLAKNPSEGDSEGKEPVVQTLLAWVKQFGSSLG